MWRHGTAGKGLAALLPDTSEEGTIAMGERFRHAVLAQAITYTGSPESTVRVSRRRCLPPGPGWDIA